MEKQPEPAQLSFAMPEVGEQKYDPRIESIRIVYPLDNPQNVNQETKSSVEPEEGVSLSFQKYYENRKKAIQRAAAANSRRSWLPHTDTPEGFDEAYKKYGDDVFEVIEGAERNANALQDNIDELFLVDELVDAGFAAEAVRKASKKYTDDINEQFVGPLNEKARVREYKNLDKKIEEHTKE